MTQCQCDELIAGSTNTVRLINLIDSDGDYRADATVTVTIKNMAGSTISGASALSMPYVGGDDLEYVGTVPYTASLVAGTRYQVLVTAVLPASAGQRTFLLVKVAE